MVHGGEKQTLEGERRRRYGPRTIEN